MAQMQTVQSVYEAKMSEALPLTFLLLGDVYCVVMYDVRNMQRKTMASLQYTLLALLLFFSALIWYGVAQATQSTLTVTFLDVGQGDAIFIEAPSGLQALVDGGPNAAVLRGLSRAMPFFDRSIDVVVATHPDQDHIGGLIDVLESYTVSEIIVSDIFHDTALNADFTEHAEAEEATVLSGRRGQVIDLGDGAYLRILFPDRLIAGGDTNDASIITQLVYGETAFLLTGDASQAVENYITTLESKMLKSDVLKVGHHGSRTSSSELFVGWADPEYAVISRGCDNRFGHPHTEVLATLARFNIETLDTCEEGSITFESDGSQVRLR